MELPYTPTGVFYKSGGTILEVSGIGHQTLKPEGGYSRDYWYYLGRVKWSDTGKESDTTQIDAGGLCADTPEGMREIGELSELMMAYLREHGEWCDEGKHRGWYAKDRSAAKSR